jgi:uncharacterized protein (TIGR00288 family)
MEKLAVLIDYENFCCPPEGLDRLLKELSKRGSILLKRAYADWVRCGDARKKFLAEQVEMIEVPNSVPGKNSVDIRLVVDAMEFALRKEFLTTFVIVSADADYLPLLQRLREFNKKSIVVSASSTTSSLIQRNCDEYINGDAYLSQPEAKLTKTAIANAPKKLPVPIVSKAKVQPWTQNQLQHLQDVLHTVWADAGFDAKINSSGLANRIRTVDPQIKWSDYGCKNFQTLVSHLVTCNFLKAELVGTKVPLISLVRPPHNLAQHKLLKDESESDPVSPVNQLDCEPRDDRITFEAVDEGQPRFDTAPLESRDILYEEDPFEVGLDSVVVFCLDCNEGPMSATELLRQVKWQRHDSSEPKLYPLQSLDDFMKFLQILELQGLVALKWCSTRMSYLVSLESYSSTLITMQNLKLMKIPPSSYADIPF